MRKLIIPLLVCLMIVALSNSCVSTRKNDRSLEGLMLQENTKLRINHTYYSNHSMKARKDVTRRIKKIGRN
jgi:hypothetical protein